MIYDCHIHYFKLQPLKPLYKYVSTTHILQKIDALLHLTHLKSNYIYRLDFTELTLIRVAIQLKFAIVSEEQ